MKDTDESYILAQIWSKLDTLIKGITILDI